MTASDSNVSSAAKTLKSEYVPGCRLQIYRIRGGVVVLCGPAAPNEFVRLMMAN
jgi:hypothetical protein